MKNAGVTLCVLLVAAGTLRAGLGDVEYVPCEPGKGLRFRPLIARPQEFGKAGPDSGTVNPNAPVATLKSGSFVVKAAIDSKEPDAKTPDIVRLDFSGKGKFNDDHVVPLRLPAQSDSSEYFRLGPKTLQLERNGQTLPVTVNGSYHKSGTYRSLRLGLGLAVQATCRFGDKTYPVRLMDGNSNLRLDDSPRRSKSRGRTVGLTHGDTIAIDLGDGEFGKSVRKAFYGQPIPVNGTWYEVKLSPDGKKISTKALDVKTGQIKVDHDDYCLMLVGEKYPLYLLGDRESVPVPADRYTITQYWERVRGPSGTPRGMVHGGFGAASSGRAKVIEVVGGKATELKIGSPLTASVQISQRGRTVGLSLNLVDGIGISVDSIDIPRKGRPPAPTLKIYDETGKVVHAGKMKYG